MTEMELMRLIGEADDQYIMESRRRPKKRSIPWKRVTQVAAACLIVAVVGAAGAAMLRQGGFHKGAPFAGSSTAAEAAAEDAAITMEDAESAVAPEAAEEAEEAPAEEAAEGSAADTQYADAYGVQLLASAVYPDDPEAAYSATWSDNQTTDDTKAAMNAFAYSTASAVLRDKKESGCFSPLSLYQTLSILASGAGGETQAQLLSLLGQSDPATLADQSGKLYRANYQNDEYGVLKIANSLWLDDTAADGSPVAYSQDWVMSAARDYYADVFEAEFAQENTALALGEWIARNTGGLLHPAPGTLGLDDSDVMTIVNTLWYDCQWENAFDPGLTRPDTFTTGGGETVTCDFMHATSEDSRAIETDEYTKSYLNLYRSRMIVVLPKEGVDVDQLLTEEKLWEIFENGSYQAADVIWSMPKFSTDATYPLKDTLTGLGITDAFNGSLADFSAISDTDLVLSQVQQGTHISLNEDGVQAAAYTIAGMEAAAAPMEETLPRVTMDLNRPFIYLITSTDGSTLFLGVVREPGT